MAPDDFENEPDGAPDPEPKTDAADLTESLTKAEDARRQLSRTFKPSECNVRIEDDEVTVDMHFYGFDSFESANERVPEVAKQLERHPSADSVNFQVSSEGEYDHETGETDDRPSGWVNAQFTTGDE